MSNSENKDLFNQVPESDLETIKIEKHTPNPETSIYPELADLQSKTNSLLGITVIQNPPFEKKKITRPKIELENYQPNEKDLNRINQNIINNRNPQEQIDLLTIFIEKGISEHHPLVMRGICHFLQGYLTNARIDFEKTIEIDPNNIASRLYLGAILLKEGQEEEGLNLFQETDMLLRNKLNQLEEEEEKHPESKTNKEKLKKYRHRLNSVIRISYALGEKQNNETLKYVYLGRILSEENKHQPLSQTQQEQSGANMIRDFIEEEVELPNVNIDLENITMSELKKALHHLRKKYLNQYIPKIEEIIEERSDILHIAHKEGIAANDKGDFEKAKASFSLILENVPENKRDAQRAHSILAEINFNQSNLDKANFHSKKEWDILIYNLSKNNPRTRETLIKRLGGALNLRLKILNRLKNFNNESEELIEFCLDNYSDNRVIFICAKYFYLNLNLDKASELIKKINQDNGSLNVPATTLRVKIALKKGNHQEAYTFATALLRQDSNDPGSKTLLGNVYLAQGNKEEALNLFHQNIEKNKDPFSFAMSTLKILKTGEELPEIEKNIEQLIIPLKKPEDILSVTGGITNYYLDRGLLEEAKKIAGTIKALKHKKAKIHFELGEIEEALTIVEEILKDIPMHQGAIILKGQILYHEFSNKQSLLFIQDHTQKYGIELKDQPENLIHLQGMALQGLEQFEEAQKLFEILLKSKSKETQSMGLQGLSLIALKKGETNKSKRNIARAQVNLSTPFQEVSLNFQMAQNYIKTGQIKVAKYYLEESLKIDPNDDMSLITLASLELRNFNPESAQKALILIEKASPQKKNTKYYLLKIYYKAKALIITGDKSQALGLINESLMSLDENLIERSGINRFKSLILSLFIRASELYVEDQDNPNSPILEWLKQTFGEEHINYLIDKINRIKKFDDGDVDPSLYKGSSVWSKSEEDGYLIPIDKQSNQGTTGLRNGEK